MRAMRSETQVPHRRQAASQGGPTNRYAYGFGDSVFEGRHIIGHNGGWPGVAANFDMFSELGYTAVILMNVDSPAMRPVVTQLRQLIPVQ